MSNDIPRPDWSTAPEWAQYYTINADGRQQWWKDEPFCEPDACDWWLDPTDECEFEDFGRPVDMTGIDWRGTLRQRPQENEQ